MYPTWFDGKVLSQIFMGRWSRPTGLWLSKTLPDAVYPFLTVGAFTFEMALPFLLLWPKTRRAGVILGILFHLSIDANALYRVPRVPLDPMPARLLLANPLKSAARPITEMIVVGSSRLARRIRNAHYFQGISTSWVAFLMLSTLSNASWLNCPTWSIASVNCVIIA